MKVELDKLFKFVPSLLHQYIRDSHYCTSRSETLVINSDESRKQGDNVDNCRSKLYNMIRDIGHTKVPGETSDSQIKRVKTL